MVRRILKCSGHAARCRACGATAHLAVHHWPYRSSARPGILNFQAMVVADCLMRGIVILCDWCHNDFHTRRRRFFSDVNCCTYRPLGLDWPAYNRKRRPRAERKEEP